MAEVPDLNIEIDPKCFENGLLKVLENIRPEWKPDEIQFKLLNQGYMNLMVCCFVTRNQETWVVARVFGTVMDFGFRRDVEVKCCKLFAELDIGPPVYATFNNGLCVGFVEGTTYTWDDLAPFRDLKLGRSVARALARHHCQRTKQMAIDEYDTCRGVDESDLMSRVINKWPDVFIDVETTEWYISLVGSKSEIKAEFNLIKDKIDSANIPNTLCIGDSNPTNVIYNVERDKVTFVDYEAAGFWNPTFDLASFLANSAFGMAPAPEDDQEYGLEYKKDFLRAYITEKNGLDFGEERCNEKEVDRLLANVDIMFLAYDFFVYLFVPILANAPQDIGGGKDSLLLGTQRLKRYYRNKQKMLSIIIPEEN